jgi:SAM-dependent methyltransferase
MDETSKSTIRRLHDIRYANTYFVGNGIDIGAGADSLGKYKKQFPLINEVRAWDIDDGDAQFMESIENDTYDFVHSSHCLEHLYDPIVSFGNWIRICKPGGHIITCVPDEDLYEQGIFPSTFNFDHKTTWTITKRKSWSPVSINLFDLLTHFSSQIEILKVELINGSFIYDSIRYDQTRYISECAIEFIIRKKLPIEIQRFGRYPNF